MEKSYGVNEALCTAGVFLLFSVAQIFRGIIDLDFFKSNGL